MFGQSDLYLSCGITFSAGIANVEEFSLLVEGQEEHKEDAEKMGTIKRVRSMKMSIMEQLLKAMTELYHTYSVHVHVQAGRLRNMQCTIMSFN